MWAVACETKLTTCLSLAAAAEMAASASDGRFRPRARRLTMRRLSTRDGAR
jgi:hypothetical protein